jgi:two-component system phosphate regulon sensor histidine kinase PhoR
VKTIRVNYIIILVILAMIALLLIQFVQSAQIYYRKSNEFNKRFSTTMESVAIHHEKTEDIRKFMQLANKDFSGQYKDILKAEFQNLLSAKESISIQDTSIFEDGEMQNFLIIRGRTYDSISG